AVLLVGPDDIRFRDLTRRIAGDSSSKQFCRILGRKSLFRQTRARLKSLFPCNRQGFVLSRAHARYYSQDLTGIGGSCVIAQPPNRGTGIAIILALVHMSRRDREAVMGFFSCDHYYQPGSWCCETRLQNGLTSAAPSCPRYPDSKRYSAGMDP